MEGAPSDRQNAPGKELDIPQSAEDFLDSFMLEAELGILKAADEIQEKKENEAREARINAHYEKMATQALKRLWALCGKKTGHLNHWTEMVTPPGGYEPKNKTHTECKYCGKPSKTDSKADMQFKIMAAVRLMAKKLRELDKEAGMEYIP